jgi:ribosomal protein S14
MMTLPPFDLRARNVGQASLTMQMFCQLDGGIHNHGARRQRMETIPQETEFWMNDRFADWLFSRSANAKAGKPCENCGEGRSFMSGFCSPLCEAEAYKKATGKKCLRSSTPSFRMSMEQRQEEADAKWLKEQNLQYPRHAKTAWDGFEVNGWRQSESHCTMCSGRGVFIKASTRKITQCPHCGGSGIIKSQINIAEVAARARKRAEREEEERERNTQPGTVTAEKANALQLLRSWQRMASV